MYNQLIYFIVVLLLFSLQSMPGKAVPPVSTLDVLYSASFFLVFNLYCRSSFRRILRSAAAGFSTVAITRAYHRTQAYLSVLALVFLVVYLYGFNMRIYLRAIPGFDRFTTISGLAGLIIYAIHLTAIWFWSHSVYQAIYGSRVPRLNFLKGQIAFTSVILIPWFLISAVMDLLQFIKMPFFMAPDGEFLLVAVVLVGFILVGPWLVVRLWGCEPLPPDPVKMELESFCRQHRFRSGGFLLWPLFGGEMLTAGIVGILPAMRYILITSGLLRILDVSELKAVVAHEMGHVRKKHLLLFVALFILFIKFIYDVGEPLGDLVMFLSVSNRTIAHWLLSPGEVGSSLFSLISFLPVIAMTVIYFRFIFGFFLRNSERQADLYAMELVGNPLPLISSFEKIAYRSGRIEDLPSWHHYSIRQRIEFLVRAFENRELIRKHNRKLYSCVVLFVAVISGLLLFNMRLNESGVTKNLRAEVQLRLVGQAVEMDPENPGLQGAYGGLLFENGRYSEAESVLRGALTFSPEDAVILNNLAWLYATSPSPFRNPREALELAYKAATLKPEPFILDTLAEAYFINGRYKEALDTINKAIAQGGPQQDHFTKQKDKFEKALSGRLRVS